MTWEGEQGGKLSFACANVPWPLEYAVLLDPLRSAQFSSVPSVKGSVIAKRPPGFHHKTHRDTHAHVRRVHGKAKKQMTKT